MGRDSKLTVLMPTAAGQRFACQSCSRCCRQTVVPVTQEDRRRIDAQDWSDQIDAEPCVRLGKEWMLNKTDDGACVFLDEQGLCRIHATYGPQAKPLACRLFPFNFIPGCDGRRRVSLRFDCPSVARSKGRPVVEHGKEAARLSRELGRPSGDRPATPELRRGVPAGPRHIDALVDHFDKWFAGSARPWAQTMVGAVRVTETLAAGRRDDLHGRRFDELVAGAFRAAGGATTSGKVAPATSRQRRMLRELVFVHTDHTNFVDLRASWVARLGRRLRALPCARAFRRGAGNVPPVRGLPPGAHFADIELIKPAEQDADSIAELLARYLRVRLQSHTWFGSGFHGWSAFDGLRGLWTSVAVTAWIARWLAAGDHRPTFCHEDVVRPVAGASSLVREYRWCENLAGARILSRWCENLAGARILSRAPRDRNLVPASCTPSHTGGRSGLRFFAARRRFP